MTSEAKGALHVVAPGPLLTVQDLGRRGVAHWGVARSGAADRGALRRANRLVGNREDAAALEVLAGGATLRAEQDLVVAVTGALCEVVAAGRIEGQDVALRLRPGDELALGPVRGGLRSYVAVRGGIDVPPVLGSRSYDQLGDLGPAPLRAGYAVPVGHASPGEPSWAAIPVTPLPAVPVLRVLPGPRVDWLEDWLSALLDAEWKVGTDLDRTGVRLTGQALRRRAGELLSEGTVPGAVQVPADGQPLLLGPDAGVTGGYPVVAVVVDADLDLVGQLSPGTTVRFRPA